MVANILLMHAFFSGPLFTLGVNAVSWSISVEAFFYAIFPTLIKRKLSIIVAGLCLLLAVALPRQEYVSLQTGFPNFYYFNPLGRLLEFSFGMVCYILYLRIRCPAWLATALQILAIVLLVVAVRMSAGLPENDRNAVLLWPFGAVIICYSLSGLASGLIGSRLFVVLGETSFAFYMIHHMLFRLIDRPLAALNLGSTVSILLALGFAQIAALIIHYGFERPARTLLTPA